MSTVYDLYGFQSEDLDDIAPILEKILEITWTPRYSSYLGPYYSWGLQNSENIQFQYNYWEEEADWAERDFAEYPTLLYINQSPRFAEIEQRLLNSSEIHTVLLRRSKLD